MLQFTAGAWWAPDVPVGGWGKVSNLILPSIALALAPMAYIVRLTRVSMLDVLGTDYVRTGRAKGLSRAVVIWKHWQPHEVNANVRASTGLDDFFLHRTGAI